VAGKGSAAAIKLNGILIDLQGSDEPQDGSVRFSAPGTMISIRRLGDEADWRQNAELVFELEQGLSVGYRGFFRCARK